METIQEKLQYYLVKDMHDHGDSEISNIIELGILNTDKTNQWTPSITNVSKKWKTAVQEQSRIGWSHILCGRFSKSLISTMNKHYESQELSSYLYNGTRWAKKLIQYIWITMLELWKTRNNIIYNKNSQEVVNHLRKQLEPKIRTCYSMSHIIPAHERNTWFSMTLEEKLMEDPTKAGNWLQGASRLIKIAKREQRHRPKESAILERFHKLPNLQPREAIKIINPRAFPQEPNPD
jgi:hypothetical protein